MRCPLNLASPKAGGRGSCTRKTETELRSVAEYLPGTSAPLRKELLPMLPEWHLTGVSGGGCWGGTGCRAPLQGGQDFVYFFNPMMHHNFNFEF